ncbi:MAG TPA: phosphoribosyltransferase family protein [Acidimicrobiales bacterium]|jgi:hypoxanthine phosphoribosyltransferase|nr:hypoxanthine phosphoribosyltransferase [Actinomycetota bacterium]MDP6061870.1 phosphoribosyltransferase family protein [Acidimicrobiales bacterium]MDP7209682.1 phosphoribosyltransferase family protein [Acidimicrobiales bacterium]HJL89660.1 phosphoribosyltransferase family protein [Acidimicrobiales bacterium]HJO99639.1 phosphoribosyltransferase family protein [Acidimicrobiales bacterium]|tara:strand:- start:113676 stop:114308 length:633 start_codon:yes stop_codon:yes gene_type:complete
MTEPRLLYGSDEIAARVAELGEELSGILEDGAVAVGVLKGCLPFMADLVRCIDRHLEIDFVALSAFAPDSGRIRLTRDVVSDLSGRQVLLIEGVVDTGFRLDFLRRHMLDHGPTEVLACTLLDRSDRRILPTRVDYSGFVTDEGFVVGYGLDHHGRYRNLPSVATVDLTQLESEYARGDTAMADTIMGLAGRNPIGASPEPPEVESMVPG